ncbi:unnamed protein product [Polarella glacialis]|uniref:AFG1-like ATPase n=1 Tax=Polarella glacialis TaxID=89957 RepID=A0A813EWL7_POLGL|nr:unnamed protein product [Polarella glacialis]
MWGDVGRGKSLLMDILVAALEGDNQDGPMVLRLHHHDFMRQIHERLHAFRQLGASREAVQLAAKEFANRGRPYILCLDEFQITNIADAVILRSLFEALMANDVMVVMTSNRPPADLYKDGLNHMMYMPPFRQLLETTIGVHHIDAPQDYRAAKAAAESANGQAGEAEANYMVLPTAAGALEEAFERASGSTLEKAGSCQLAVSWGRRLECPAAHAGVSWFSFSQLCATALSADDYSVLLQKNAIHTLVLSDVPRFALEQHNEARRFTNLVDCLYEHQGRLICTAEAPLDSLMAEMEILSHVPLTTQPAMGIAGSEVSLRKHGDVTFAVSVKSPCRPDSFATEVAIRAAGTAEFDPIMVAIKAARLAASKAAMGANPVSTNMRVELSSVAHRSDLIGAVVFCGI